MAARRLILLVGAVLLVAGVIALLVPVSTPDGNGGSIGCGNAISEDLASAREANSKGIANVPILNEIIQHPDFVAQCESAVSSRRAWSIPLAVIGLLAAGGSFVVGGRSGVGSKT